MQKIFVASGNQGKLKELSKIFGNKYEIISPKTLDIKLNVPEDEKDLKGNAKQKVSYYANHPNIKKLREEEQLIILGDDTGLSIDCLNGEPGIKVRRWKGYEMEDEEIIEYCLERMKNFQKKEERCATFQTVIALLLPEKNETNNQLQILTFDGTLKGVILNERDPITIKGFPFQSLFYVEEWGKLLGNTFHEKDVYPTHREQATQKVIQFLNILQTKKNSQEEYGHISKKPKIACKFGVNCRNITTCRFYHDQQETKQDQKTKKKIPCKFLNCHRPNCPYSHPNDDQEDEETNEDFSEISFSLPRTPPHLKNYSSESFK